MIHLISYAKGRTVFTILTFLLFLAILLQLAGCSPTQPEYQLDPNVLAIEELTRAMPDEVAPDMAKIFKAGIKVLSDSLLLKACLSEGQLTDLPNVMSDAHNLHWGGVNSTARFKEMLLSSEMTAVYDLLDSAAGQCNSPLASNSGDTNAFTRNLISEALYIDNDYVSFSNPKDELQQELDTLLACMADTDRLLSKACNSPIASEGGGDPDPDERLIGYLPPPTTISSPASGDPDPGEPQTAEASWFDNLWNKLSDQSIADTAVGAAAGVGAVAACALIVVCAGSVAVAGAVGIFATATGAISYHVWTAPDPNDETDERMCPGPYDARLTADHPLQGANYQIEGMSLGIQELYNGCTCLGVDPNDPDPRAWGCKSEAEQRRDCRRNPYGPDDAPRPECIELLFEDNGIDPPDQCSAALCPAPYTLVNQEQCTCGLPTSPDGLVPEPGVQDACVETQCGPDSVPVVVNGACTCAPMGGTDSPPEPPSGDGSGSPPGPPSPESP